MKKVLIIVAILFSAAMSGNSAFAQNANSSDQTNTNVQKADYDQNIKIKKKPHPNVSQSCSKTSGIARVRVTFDKSGNVTNVELVLASGCEGFDNNALKAAKKIKFTPAMKNGEAVTVTKLVEYAFALRNRGF